MGTVCTPFLFSLSGAEDALRLPIPDNNTYGQQTSRLKQLKLASTLAHKLPKYAPGTTQKQQDKLLTNLYAGIPRAVQAATGGGLITVGTTESRTYVETVFLTAPSLVGVHTKLHKSLHPSDKQSEPLLRHDMYTQTHQMYTLAKAIENNRYGSHPSVTKWGSFLGSADSSGDRAHELSMGMFTKSPKTSKEFPSYIIPQLNSCYSAEVTHNPKDTRYLESLLKQYDKDLGQVNSELRQSLSNTIFVDMTEDALKRLSVPTTLPEFFAWRELEISNPLNVRTQSGLHPVGLRGTVRSQTMEDVWRRLNKEGQSVYETVLAS